MFVAYLAQERGQIDIWNIEEAKAAIPRRVPGNVAKGGEHKRASPRSDGIE